MPIAGAPAPWQHAYSQAREVNTFAPLGWLKKGWSDLRTCPGPSLFYGLSFILGGYFFIWLLRGAPQYIAVATTGFLIAGPFLAMGLYEISRRRERGKTCSLVPTLTVWRENFGQLAVFSLILMGIYLIWALVALSVFRLFYAASETPSYGDFLRHVILTDDYGFLITYFASGAMFAFVAFAVSLISIPLIMDRGLDAKTAVFTSAAALARNPMAMMVWSGLITGLAMLGLVTFFLGLLVVGPLLGHATWHAYRDLVTQP